MVDITAKLFWYRTKEWYQNMADKLNEVVYTDDSKETVDVINLLLLGWILLGLIVYIIGTVIANQLRKRKAAFSASEAEISDGKAEPADEPVTCASATEVKSSFAPRIPVPEPEKKIQRIYVIPTCCGDEQEIVDWINSVFSWIYKNRVISPVIDAWVSALNARTRLLSTEHGILIDFKDVHFTSGPPDVQGAFEVATSRGDLNVFCDLIIEDVSADITVTQVEEKDKTVTPFSLNIKKIDGKVDFECIPEDLSFVGRYSEKPQTELSVVPPKEVTSIENPQALSDVVCEICLEALASAIVDLKFSCYPDCPRLTVKRTVSEDEVFESTENEAEEKLLVKIIKASNLGQESEGGCIQPYCVVEMDEPPQKFETRALEAKGNPFWDESFTFTVKDVSAELLFEIYDKGKPSKENFLGLGIVSVDELIKNPSQRQIIPLQSRPLEDDKVSGTLTTEFLFLNQITPVSEAAHLAQKTVASNGKTIETNSRVTAGGTVITTTTIKRTKEESCDIAEVTSKTNAIPLPVSNLTPVHDTSEELLQKKNEQNVHLTLLQEMKHCNNQNEACIEASTNCLISTNGHLLNGVNNFPKQNGFVAVDETATAKQDFSEIEQNNLHLPEILLSNDVLKLACSEVHVHDDTNNTPILIHIDNNNVENEFNINGIEKNPVLEISNDPKMHEMGVVVEPIVLLIDSNHCHSDTSSDLPPIDESVEYCSTLGKSVENKDDGEADLTGTALKELEKHSKPNSTSKSTLIIHSVQRADSSVSESLEASPASHMSKDSRTSYSESVPSSPSQDRSGDDRSRPKEKKSIFGSLRRRLSFRKARSKSAENRSESSNYSQGSSRSASSDRIRSKGQRPSPIKGKFIGMQFLAVPGSTRSSLSEMSGISASSSRTYINENSTLVIETNENGIIKRYLIPNSLAHRGKWKKRGNKLHIYNDHVFVAKHLSGSTVCKVCQKYLTRRPGKQGYECRGCNLQCHKSCHVKVDSYCANSTINSMEVEYVQDPKGATPKSI